MTFRNNVKVSLPVARPSPPPPAPNTNFVSRRKQRVAFARSDECERTGHELYVTDNRIAIEYLTENTCRVCIYKHLEPLNIIIVRLLTV